MFGKKKNLRDLLSASEAHSVDTLLRRVDVMLNSTSSLSSDEKVTVMDGCTALKRIFYKEKVTLFGFGRDESGYDGLRAHQDAVRYALYVCILMFVLLVPMLAYVVASGSDSVEVIISIVAFIVGLTLFGGVAIRKRVNEKWRRAIEAG